MIGNSLNLNINVEFQKAIWLVVPLFPILFMFLIGALAETDRLLLIYLKLNQN